MPKWCFALLLVIVSYGQAFTQTVLRGTVREADSESSFPEAIVTLTEAGQSAVLSYAVADKEGKFTLSFGQASKQYTLNVSALGYESASVSLEQFREGSNTIRLNKSAITLKEVLVRSPPIRKWGDTIDYKVNEFSEQKDRSIADVLRKLPGIEVQSDGRILYEGKAIQHFYIEGMDLLGGKYNLASNNLPSSAVSSVQILENHQPIRVLDSLVTSQRASLNLVLKKDVTATGSGKLGIGAAPLLWDANLTPMLFTKKQQLIASYQTNNTGQDVSKEIKTLTLEELLEQAESDTEKQELLGIQAVSPPSAFSTSRYLFNNSHLLSTNYLLRLKKDAQLRVNFSYLNDYQRQQGQTQSTFYFPSDTLELTEVKRNKLYFHSAQATASFLRNAPKNYLKNDFRFSGFWDSQRGFIQKGEGAVSQDLSNPYYSLSNTFKSILPIGRQLVTFSSLWAFNKAPQSLGVTLGPFEELISDGPGYRALEQRIQLTSLYAHSFASLTKGIKGWTLISTLGVQLQRQQLASELTKQVAEETTSLGSDYENSLRWNREKYYGQAEALYKSKKWNIGFKLPVSLWHFAVKDRPLDQQQAVRKPTVEPSVSLKYTFAPLWYATAGYRLSYRFGEISQLNYAYILKDYRTLQRNTAPLAQTQSRNYSAGLFYRNPLSAFFSGLQYSFTKLGYNLTYQNSLQEDGSLFITAVPRANGSSAHSLTLQASKYLAPVKTTVGFNASLTVDARRQILDERLTRVRNERASYSANANARLWAWLSIDYKATVAVLKNSIGETEPENVFATEHTASVNLYPSENHYIGLQADVYHNTLALTNRNSSFGDILYRYSLPVRKVDVEVKWLNIFNTTQYTRAYINSYILIKDVYTIRPSQFLVSLKYTL